jgi:hypothetical protein
MSKGLRPAELNRVSARWRQLNLDAADRPVASLEHDVHLAPSRGPEVMLIIAQPWLLSLRGTPVIADFRRARYVKSDPAEGGKGPTTMDMRVDFLDFGDIPEIDVPDSSEVFDGTGLAKGEISEDN